MGGLTGASAAKRSAAAQAKALEEQTKQAQASAAEAARQAAIQTVQVQERDAAVRDVEAMQQADATASKAPEVTVGATDATTSTSRKRARFQAASAGIPTVSI